MKQTKKLRYEKVRNNDQQRLFNSNRKKQKRSCKKASCKNFTGLYLLVMENNIIQQLGTYFQIPDSYKLATPPQFAEEFEETETNEPFQTIMGYLENINHYDKVDLKQALTMILDYSNEAGIKIFDVRELLSCIIDDL